MGPDGWLKNSTILQRAVEFAGNSEFSQSRNNAIVDALLAAAAYLREYHNAAQAAIAGKQEFIRFLNGENDKMREAVQSVEQHYRGLLDKINDAQSNAIACQPPLPTIMKTETLGAMLATAKQEAFEQMAQYWESRGCKTEAREARRMAKEWEL